MLVYRCKDCKIQISANYAKKQEYCCPKCGKNLTGVKIKDKNEEKARVEKNKKINRKARAAATKNINKLEKKAEKKKEVEKEPEYAKSNIEWIKLLWKKFKDRKVEVMEENVTTDFNEDGYYDDTLSDEMPTADSIAKQVILTTVGVSVGLFMFINLLIWYA